MRHWWLVRACFVIVAVPSAGAVAAPPPGVAPTLFDRGNLRLSIACADLPIVTPDAGLHVSLDGQALDPTGTNLQAFEDTDDDGNVVIANVPSSVGFLAAPGHHHLRIDVPDCTSDERDIDLAGAYPERVTGRLAIANPSLEGPTGAPNWFAFAIGGYTAGTSGPQAGTTGTSDFGGSYTLASEAMQGIWLSAGSEHRHVALWGDSKFGWTSVSGTERWLGTPPLGSSPGPFPFTASRLEFDDALRIGARVPLGHVAFAAGVGVGMRFDTMTSTQPAGGASFTPELPDGLDFSWYVPVWAAITLKPSCNWGVQAIAAYDVDPTDSASTRTELLAGLEFQPSDACSEAPYIAVKP